MKFGVVLRSVCLVLVLLFCGSVPVMLSQARSHTIYEVSTDQGRLTTESLEEAFEKCYEATEGSVRIVSDDCIELSNSSYTVTQNMRLIITNGAHVTIGTGGLQLEGRIIIKDGVLDLQNSVGILRGGGTVKCTEAGQYIKRNYEVMRTEEIGLVGEAIWYGQTLAQSTILKGNISWRSSIEGEWKYVDEQSIPEAGNQLVDICFVPKNTLTYDSIIYEKAGSVTVYAVPTEDGQEDSSPSDSNTNYVNSETSIVSKEPIIITQMVSKKSTIISTIKKKKAPKVKKVERKKRKIFIICEKKKNCIYEIRYGTRKKLKGSKKIRFKSSSFTIKKLKKNKKYYFKVRTYNKKTKQYSKWSVFRCV